MPALKTYAAPTVEPLTVDQVMEHLRLDEYETMLPLLIASARASAEAATSLALMTQTLDLYLDAFPAAEIILPRSPLQSVTSITYTDTDGATQTLTASEYLVDTASAPPRIVPAYGKSWPSTRQQLNAVQVRFVCGHTDAASVPADVKAWMLLSIGTAYEHRESIATGEDFVEMPHIDRLVAANRVHNFTSY